MILSPEPSGLMFLKRKLEEASELVYPRQLDCILPS